MDFDNDNDKADSVDFSIDTMFKCSYEWQRVYHPGLTMAAVPTRKNP